jgi:hypothetical protein
MEENPMLARSGILPPVLAHSCAAPDTFAAKAAAMLAAVWFLIRPSCSNEEINR